MANIRKILDLLTPRERRQGLLLLGMVVIMAMFDVVGVASIMPFMAVLANPQVIESNIMLARLYNSMGYTNPQHFLFFLGVLVFITLVISAAFKMLTQYAQLRFSLMGEYNLSLRLVTAYLKQPYTWFLNRHTADLGKAVLSEVNQIIGLALIPLLQIIANGMVILALVILLVLVDPWLAIIVGGFLGSLYILIYKAVSNHLAAIGAERLKANEDRFTVVSEAFGGIKEIKVGALEDTYIRHFSQPARVYARHQTSVNVIAHLPRHLLEILAFGGILLIVLYLLGVSSNIERALPIASLYAFAAYRLMPALQQVYASGTTLRFIGPALDAIHKDVTELDTEHQKMDSEPVIFQHAINLQNINFTYPNSTKPALANLNLHIKARSTVGLVGASGSGKSTTVDIVLGLLVPNCGMLSVDGLNIGPNNLRGWQKIIGYVPQHIYLADDTITANIAFGLPLDLVDRNAVEQAARIANLHDFVSNQLPDGYATRVGERGVRLSGGQRQRIGIARALYHNPQVLVLDEATSALDNLTEQAVMEAVNNLNGEITIILVAHRLSTVRQCDQIYLLDNGELIAQGSYSELIKENEIFRSMAAVNDSST
ncbi:ATP-binding cassette domain-containing protein [Oxalobacter sp. OttesenSCG-928-P03]|nr:ATP-binding cassette domain-containing protein [Oxalobacter sp. OttesenSCG-928-P03]